MRITEITVRYGVTVNLGNYSNAKPEIELTATIDEGDDVVAVEQYLWTRARHVVQAHADNALEAHGQQLIYDNDSPRYAVVGDRHWAPSLVAIVPDAYKNHYKPLVQIDSRLRIGRAKLVAEQMCKTDVVMLDCANGDFTILEEAIRQREIAAQAAQAASQRTILDETDEDETDEDETDEDGE